MDEIILRFRNKESNREMYFKCGKKQTLNAGSVYSI